MNIVLIGPPGSGKGTQAEKLCDRYKVAHISSGDILRDEVKRGTEFGKKVKHYMDKGEIGPQELITEIVLNYLSDHCKNGFMLDGFPRTLYQAKELTKTHAINAAFFLDVSEAEVVTRISGRRSCSTCKKIYHTRFNPPQKENQCDVCLSHLMQRNDDNEQTVRNRMRVYLSETAPVIDYYKKSGILHEIDGTCSPDGIFQQITSYLGVF